MTLAVCAESPKKTVARRRVLVAVSSHGHQRLAKILCTCHLCPVKSAAQLVRLLDASAHDMVIIGAHFEESNTLGVLARICKHPNAAMVVCVRGVAGNLGPGSVDGLRLACRELGARGFVDLTAYSDDDASNGRLRRLFEGLFVPRDAR
jgi:hypothetical protein